MKIISKFFEDHNKNISFFFTGKRNVIGRYYADEVIKNEKNSWYMKIGTITFDSSIQSTEENTINEEFKIKLENFNGSQFVANTATVVIAGHAVGKRPDRRNFKCTVIPEVNYVDFPQIMLAEEDGLAGNKINIWVNTQGVKRIYLTKIFSNAKNASPLNGEYLDSGYYFNFTRGSELVNDADTTNIVSNISRNQFATGVNIFSSVDSRLRELEAIRYPDFRFTCVNTDDIWVPDLDNVNNQKVMLLNADYSMSLSSTFINMDITNKRFSVTEKGLYMLQVISGLNTKSAVNDSNIELSIYKNEESIPGGSLRYKLKADNGDLFANPIGLSGGSVVLMLEPTDYIDLRFKFIGIAESGVVNQGTKIQVIKLVDVN